MRLKDHVKIISKIPVPYKHFIARMILDMCADHLDAVYGELSDPPLKDRMTFDEFVKKITNESETVEQD